MDTPEKCQIQTPISKFEDSPVFNFINNLSPIEPVKTTRISQTFNSLTFTTIPSIFASPHLHTNRDSRFLRRPGCYTLNVNELNHRECVMDPPTARQNLDTGVSTSGKGVVVEPFTRTQDPPSTLDFSSQTSASGGGDMGSPLSPPVPETSGLSMDVSMHLHAMEPRPTEMGGNTDCDWDCLISNSSRGLPVFDSPDYKKAFSGKMRISTSTSSDECKDFNPAREDPTDGPSNKLLEGIPGESVQDGGDGKCSPCSSKPVSASNRGLRRRCLVFEVAGAHRRSLTYAADYRPSSDPLQSEGDASSSPSRCNLPRIGLHLNSLALSSVAPCDSRQPDVLPLNYLSSPSPHEQADSSLAISCVDTDKDSADNDGRFPTDDVSGHLLIDEISQSSPKRKRPRLNQGGENENCKRCNCKKSKCLKLYCECFAAGVYCADPCSCQECFNKSGHEDVVLATRKQIVSRNPLAFAPKVIRAYDHAAETGEDPDKTPASARHKRGCNCKKSNCLKKYCECYQGGVGCSFGCRCEGCKNTFGRKEGAGSSPDEEVETAVVDQSLRRRMTIQTKQEQITDLPLLATPLNICRWSAGPPLSAKSNLQRGGRRSTSSSDISAGPPKNPDSGASDPKPKEDGDEEMPDVLSSPGGGGGIKSASPNSKRVSPPTRGGRKVVLKSIPAFPSLTRAAPQ